MEWIVSSERVVHERLPWVKIRKQDIILPNGDELHNYILLDERDGCLIVAVTRDGKAILLEQYRHRRGTREVGLPSGFLDGSENPLETARRELLEETGHQSDSWEHLGTLFTNSNRGCRTFDFYLALDAMRVAPPILEAGEADITVHLVPVQNLERWLERANSNVGMAATTGILLALAALRKRGRDMNTLEKLWQTAWNKGLLIARCGRDINTWKKLWRTARSKGSLIVRRLMKHCIFCQRSERDGEVLVSIGRYSGYGETKSYLYHESCLRDVVDDPEAYGHKMIDVALDIINCKELKEQRKRRTAEWRAMRRQQIIDFRDQRLP